MFIPSARLFRPALALAAGTLLLGVAAAAQQQQPPTRDPHTPSNRDNTQPPPAQRPGSASPTRGASDATALLQSLEGTWNVTMQMPGETTEAGTVINGVATRRWILDQSVLQEDVRMNMNGNATPGSRAPEQTPTQRDDPSNPSHRPGGPHEDQQPPADPSSPAPRPQQPDSREPSARQPETPRHTPGGDYYEGLGLFSVDSKTGQITHVWADSKSKGMVFSIGTIDPATRTITFRQHSGEIKPEADSPVRDRDAKSNTAEHPLVTLRIVNENEHVVTMRQADDGGRATEYRITYQRMSGGNPSTPGINNPSSRDPSNPAQPNPRDSNRPGNGRP